MKKIIMSIALVLCITTIAMAQARVEQDPRLTKNGYRFLPQAGDFAIGIDATPFFEFAGNAFNGNNFNTAPMFNGVDHTIYGKYFLTDNSAVRAKLRLNIYGDNFKQSVRNDTEVSLNPLNPLATVIDVKSINTTDVSLSVGYEWRRGYGRIQGFWGAEVMLGLSGGKTSYAYGNEMTELNQTPTTTSDFGNTVVGPKGRRTTEIKTGTGFTFGVGAFAGVEYFIAPHLAVGGELGLSLATTSIGQTTTTTEAFNASSNQVELSHARSRNGNNLAQTGGLKTHPYAKLFMMFYF